MNLNTTNKKVIIFDFDGTLGDTLPMFIDIYNEIAIDFGFQKVKKEDVEKFRDMKLQKIFDELKISKIKLPILIRKCRKKIKKEIINVKPIEGITEMIKELKSKGYVLGILTSNTKDNVKIFLDNNEMNEYFDFVYSAKNIFGKDKVLSKILKRYNLCTNEVIYIGDEVRDIEASKKIRVRVIGVSWGFNSTKALLNAKPDVVINQTTELIKYLKNIDI